MTSTAATVARLRAAGCVYAEEEAALLAEAADSPASLESLVSRRETGEPLEYILGWVEFHGARMAVGPGVFVPRRRTEHLVNEAAALLVPGSVVVDLCSGSGAIAAALAATKPGIELYATEIDAAALDSARRNVGAAGTVLEGDLFAPLPASLRGRIDVVVANAPYVPTGEIALMPPEAREHEAAVALDGGGDGLDVQRRIAAEAPGWLVPRGHLLFETSVRQGNLSRAILDAAGFDARLARSTRLDGTAVIGRLRP
ncbi:release factor glutamine methyltransferase [Conyzicola lurida]|uniref:peptide chain release factor N(5)-glutamine methyltransferase n=1 Tax=Conyzicola lurida TaxID=1172621 RepID=A0A841AJM2_9MICO|nr:release factor glutamine methyltransferase [Conyzicola lurida]